MEYFSFPKVKLFLIIYILLISFEKKNQHDMIPTTIKEIKKKLILNLTIKTIFLNLGIWMYIHYNRMKHKIHKS